MTRLLALLLLVLDPNVRTSDPRVICSPGAATAARNVPNAVKMAVYRRDHAVPKVGVCCEVDHRLPLEVGGSNAMSNLQTMQWAEARQKDSVEHYAHRLICVARKPVGPIQRLFLTGRWRVLYQQMHGASPAPLPSRPRVMTDSVGAATGHVTYFRGDSVYLLMREPFGESTVWRAYRARWGSRELVIIGTYFTRRDARAVLQ